MHDPLSGIRREMMRPVSMISVDPNGATKKDGSKFLEGFHDREGFNLDGGINMLGQVQFL